MYLVQNVKDLFCKIGRCQWKDRVREKGESCDVAQNCKNELDCSDWTCGPQHWPRHVGETCTLGTDCKKHNVGTGTNETFDATQCCPPADGSKGQKTCQVKLQDWFGAYYCPAEVKSKGGGSKLGGKCSICGDCDGAECGTGFGNQCCGGICRQKVKDYTGGYYCPNEARGKSTQTGITPNGTGYLADGTKKISMQKVYENELARKKSFKKFIESRINIFKNASESEKKEILKMYKEKNFKDLNGDQYIAELESRSYTMKVSEKDKDGLDVGKRCLNSHCKSGWCFWRNSWRLDL